MPKPSYHHGDLKTALLVAARAILAEEGLSKLTLRGTARKAGVSQAAPYYHFPDKESLLASVAAEGFLDLADLMENYAAEAKSPADRLQKLGIGYVVFAVKNAAVFRLMQGPYFENPGKFDFLQSAADLSSAALKHAVHTCLPDADRKQLEMACAAAWALVHGTAVLRMDGRMSQVTDIEDEAELTQYITHQMDIKRVLSL